MARRRRRRQSLKAKMWRRTGPELRALYWICWTLVMGALKIWRFASWISTNFVLRDRKLRWIARSPRFHLHPAWRAIAFARKMQNIAAYGRSKCEHCGTTTAESYESDHVFPRSTHPELALDYDNTQRLCSRCNGQKSNRWVGRGRKWRRNPRLAAA